VKAEKIEEKSVIELAVDIFIVKIGMEIVINNLVFEWS